jgi:glutathione S-transferase
MSSFLELVIGNKAYSSWSMRAWLAVNAAKLEHKESVIPMNTPEFEAARTSGRLPAGKVPILQAEDTCIWDTMAIIEYVADFAPELWPKDPDARGVARSMCAEMHSGFMDLRRNLPFNTRKEFSGYPVAASARVDIARIEALWTHAREKYGAGGFFLFGRYSFADCMFAPIVSRLHTYGITLGPVAQAYADAILTHPLTQRWYAEAEKETWVIEKYQTAGGWL